MSSFAYSHSIFTSVAPSSQLNCVLCHCRMPIDTFSISQITYKLYKRRDSALPSLFPSTRGPKDLPPLFPSLTILFGLRYLISNLNLVARSCSYHTHGRFTASLRSFLGSFPSLSFRIACNHTVKNSCLLLVSSDTVFKNLFSTHTHRRERVQRLYRSVKLI